MRICLLLAVLLTLTCVSVGDPQLGRVSGILPAPLDRLLINEGHTRITPVDFAHALHNDAGHMGRVVECAECHHTLDIEREQVPAPCGRCHEPVAFTLPQDESVPHEHPPVPDL